MSDKKSTISITYKFKGDNSGLKDLVANVERMQQAFRDGVQPAEQLRTSLINFNQMAQSFEQIGASVSQLNGVVQELTQAYFIQEEAEAKLSTVMTQRMSATEAEIQSIKDLCSAQQQLGVIGDEVQMAGAQQMATFLSSTAALQTLIPAMNNLVAQQKGLNATQGDCVAIANLLGKAMQGQTSALRRVGITFNEAEEAAVKNGNEMERAAALATIITNNVGDMNAALAQGDGGKAKQISNALGDMKENLGGMVKSIAPYTSFVSSIVAATANFGRAASAMRGLYTATLGANGAFKFVTASSVASAFGMNSAGVAARFLASGLRMVMAATGVGLVIMGISAAVDAFSASANRASAASQKMSENADKMKAAQDAAKQTLIDTRAQLEKDIAATKDYNGTKAEERRMVAELNQRYGETMGYFSSVSQWYKTLVANSKDYCAQMENEATARLLANQIAENEQKIWNYRHNPDGSEKGAPKEQTTLTLGGEKKTFTIKPSEEQKFETPQRLQNTIATMEDGLAKQLEKTNEVLRERLQKTVADGANIKLPVKGSTKPPGGSSGSGSSSSSNSAKTEKTLLEQIDEQIRKNQNAVLTASEAEIPALREKTLELVKQRDKYRELQESIVKIPESEYVPPKAAELKTYKELDKALEHYRSKLQSAGADERIQINTSINELVKLRESWDNALNPKKSEPTELDNYIKGVAEGASAKFKSMKSPLAGMDFTGLVDGYREIQKILGGADGDITAEQRKSLQLAADEYARYAKKAQMSFQTMKSAWGNVKGVVSGIDGIKDALEGSGSAWDRMSSAIDGAIQVFEGIRSVIEIIRNLTEVTKMTTVATNAQTAATTTGAMAEVAAGAAKTAAAREATNAKLQEGAAGFFAGNSAIPIVGIGLAAAGVAGMIALMASLPKYADGGIAFGPTVGLFGEYAGASHNPEVVAPLSRLQSMLDTGDGGGELTCRVRGETLEFMLDRRKRRRSRM